VIDVREYERKFREVDDLLLRLKGLVLVRALLAERGASERELDEHGREIERLRDRLASVVPGSGGSVEAAAA
jgi:hypothetical protein